MAVEETSCCPKKSHAPHRRRILPESRLRLDQRSHLEFQDIFFKEEGRIVENTFCLVTLQFDIFAHERSASTLHTAMTIAVVLVGLQPWGLPVVVPRSLTGALCPWLWESFPSLATDPSMLSRKVSELPRRTIRLRVSSWTWVSLGGALEGLRAVSSQHFSGLSSR